MENSFISNVNILAAMTEILQNIRTNIETIKNVEEKSISIGKIVSLENQLNSIYANTSDLLLISNSITKLINVSNSLNEIEQVNDNYDDFFFKYDEAKNLLGKFRVELDSFFSSFPEVQNMYEEIISKNEDTDRNILIAIQSATSASSSAGVATAAKNAINTMYDTYLEIYNYKDELLLIATKLNELSLIDNSLNEIFEAYSQMFPFKSEIINVSDNLEILLEAKKSIETNMDIALKILEGAEQVIDISNAFRNIENKNTIRFNSLEIKDSLNYSKILTRIKIIEDST